MIKGSIFIIYIFLFSVFFDNVSAAQWQIQKIDASLQQRDSDIRILSRQKNEYKEYIGEATLDFPIEKVLSFVRSNQNGEWIDNTDNFDAVLLNFFESCICHEFRSFGFRRKILYYAMQEKSLCNSPVTINFGIDPKGKCEIEKDPILDNCSDIKSDYQVNEFYGYYKLIPIEKNKTKVVIYNYIDPKFGDDFFGKIKKHQFLTGAPDSLFQTLLNLKQDLQSLNQSFETSFECGKDGFIVEKSIN